MITNIYFDWGNTLAYPDLKKKFIKNKDYHTILYPDTLEILQYLHKKYKIGIISNSKASMQYFCGAIVFSNEICKKPCKNIFLQSLQKDNIIRNNYQNDIIVAKKYWYKYFIFE